MKISRSMLLLLMVFVSFLSCQRELFFDGISSGFLKKDASGNCLPVTAAGAYKIDSLLSGNNFVEVQVEVTIPGTFDIRSDTVNGYSFHQAGHVDAGTSSIRLYASGKPIASGNNIFTVKYGKSTCIFQITVLGLQAAVYSLAGAPNSCSDIFADGTYTLGKALTASNIVTVRANVTTPGFYSITGTTTNGFSFSGNGVFTSTGLQNAILKGTGTPLRAELSNVIVSNIVSTCDFGITVLSDTAGKAIYSFDGSPDACTNFIISGLFIAGIATTVSNTVTMNINVTKPGTYSISTNTANGITFNNAGTFAGTGPQTVTLTATGSPVLAESDAFIPNTGTISCAFLINVIPLPPPAIFTLSGAPNDCAPVAVNGFYIVLKPLDAANTVVIQVNVSSPGSYSLSTNTVNGITFSGSGVFTSTGLYNVTLQGTGVPQAAGTFLLKPQIGNSSCTFTVPVR